jgi:hypothetical protein
MAMGTRDARQRQHDLLIAASDLPVTAAHPFYERVNALLDAYYFDAFVEGVLSNIWIDVSQRSRWALYRSRPARLARLLPSKSDDTRCAATVISIDHNAVDASDTLTNAACASRAPLGQGPAPMRRAG